MERYKVCHCCGNLVDTLDDYSLCFKDSSLYYCSDSCYKKEDYQNTPNEIKEFDRMYKE